MYFIVFPHSLQLILDAFSTGEASKVEISVVLNKVLRVAKALQLSQNHFLFVKDLLVTLSVVLLF